jgi:hypothetical protein
MSTSSVSRVEDLFKELGLADKVQRLKDNVWALQKGSATVQVVATPEFVVVTARVVDALPATNKEGFFKMLLGANVQLQGAFFTLEANDTIRMNQVYPTEWLQARELAFIIANVATKADEWDDRLKAIVAG